jgi:hypothetical protein
MEISDLQARFSYHTPGQDEIAKFMEIRKHALNVASLINSLCPDSIEKSIAITKLEETVFWANASIARAIALPEVP